MVELVVQYPGDVDWWAIASVAPQAAELLAPIAKTAQTEGAQTGIRWAGILFTLDEFMELRGGKASTPR
jgi:hypothetical protein